MASLPAPVVSVVIPAYNAAEFVATAINSALAQTCGDIEIIVIDDASTDDTPAIIHALAQDDQRIVIRRMARNSGPGASRNAGFATARGTWIALLDADDSFAPERIAVLLSRADAHTDVVADNAALYVDGVPNGLRVIPAAQLTEVRNLTFREFIDGSVIRPATPKRVSHVFLHPMFRRAFLEQHAIIYDESSRNGEDLLFYAACFICGAQWRLTPEAMYRYAVRADSLTEIVTPADSQRMIQQMANLLAHPGVASDPDLSASFRRHIESMLIARRFRSFKSAAGAGDFGRAGAILLEDKSAPFVIARELLLRAPAYCIKALGVRPGSR